MSADRKGGMRHPDPEDFWPEGHKPMFTPDDLNAAEGSPSGREGSEGSHGREASYSDREKLAETVLSALTGTDVDAEMKAAFAALAVLAQPCQCAPLRERLAEAERERDIAYQEWSRARQLLEDRAESAEQKVAALEARLEQAREAWKELRDWQEGRA